LVGKALPSLPGTGTEGEVRRYCGMLASMLWPCAAECATEGGSESEKEDITWYYSKSRSPR